jgi:hypothetical protein
MWGFTTGIYSVAATNIIANVAVIDQRDQGDKCLYFDFSTVCYFRHLKTLCSVVFKGTGIRTRHESRELLVLNEVTKHHTMQMNAGVEE